MDLPVPDGPEMTIGFLGGFSVGDIAAAWIGREILLKREDVLLMIEGIGLDSLMKQVRLIRSLS